MLAGSRRALTVQGMHTLYVPGRPPTVNASTRHGVKVSKARAATTKQWREWFQHAALAADFEGLGPCEVEVVQHLKNRRSVPDLGSCYLVYKAAQDGLVDAGVWPDDNDAWVVKLTFLPHLVTGEDGLELRLIPVEEPDQV